MTGRPAPWPLRVLLLAETVSTAGTAMTVLAVPWFVLVTTGSATRTGIAAAAETVPLVLASALGGPLVDRIGPRRVSVASDLVSGAALAVVPLLHATVGLAFWQLCVVVAVVGLARAPGDTARVLLLPELVALARVPVERGASAWDGVNRGARMLGAPVAGALIALLGPAPVLVVDAATFLVSALLVRAGVPLVLASFEQDGPPEPYRARLRGGLAALRADRLVLGIVVMVLVTNLLDAASSSVLMPVYARQVLGSSLGLGLLYACFGVGALTGALLYGTWGPRLPRWPVYTVSFLLLGAPRSWTLAAHPPYVALLALQVVFGIGAGCLNPVLTAVELERIPPVMRSRVFGLMSAGCLLGLPVGSVLAGLAVSRAGLDSALVLAGAVYLLATLSPVVWSRTWRQMDSTRTPRTVLATVP